MKAIAIILAAASLLNFDAIVLAQGSRKKATEDVLALGSLRVPFLTILNRAISAQKTKEWLDLYKIQWPTAIEHESFDKFAAVRKHRDWRLLDFRLLRIDTVPPAPTSSSGQWTVLGCALIEEDGKRSARESIVPVYLINGVWFSGEVNLIVNMDGPGLPAPCQFHDALSLLKHP